MLAATISLLEDGGPPPPPPKPKKKPGHGGAASAGGGGSTSRPREDIHDLPPVIPLRERQLEGLGNTPETLPLRFPAALARFMGRGASGFLTTRIAGEIGKKHLGDRGEEIGAIGALVTTVLFTEDDPNQISRILGSAVATAETIHRRHEERKDERARPKVVHAADVTSFVSKAKEMGVPIRVNLKPIKRAGGASLMWFRYAIVFPTDAGREVWFYREVRTFSPDGDLDSSGTLLEQLVPT